MPDGAFEIYLAWSDKCVRVEPDTTALAALLAAGVAVETGCQTGGCGSCVLAFVEGDLIHKDTCLVRGGTRALFLPVRLAS